MKRLLPLGILLVMLLIARAGGLSDDLSWDGLIAWRLRLHDLVTTHGVAAPLLFIGVYAAVVAMSFPGAAAILSMTSGMLFGIWVGSGVACAGGTLGAILVFLAARHALAGFLASLAMPWVARFRAGLAEDGFTYVLALRLMPVFPFWLVNWVPAMLGMRLMPFVAATMIGVVPGSLIFASIGAGMDDAITAGGKPEPSLALLLPLAALGLLSLAPIGWRRWRSANRPKADTMGPVRAESKAAP